MEQHEAIFYNPPALQPPRRLGHNPKNFLKRQKKQKVFS